MGLLDDMVKQSGGLGGITRLAAENPQAVAAVISLLSGRDSSVGGTGGLGGLVDMFRSKGMGDMMSSWISTGPNPPISERQLTDVLGSQTVSQFAAKAGVPQGQAGGLLAQLLPAMVDQLTPQGSVPPANDVENTLGGLLAGLGR